MQVPAPTTLRTTGGGQGGAEPPRAQGRAFQLTAEEVRAEPDATAGMFPFFYLVILWLLWSIVYLLVSFA